MALINVEGAGVPTSLPILDEDLAVVSALSLGFTFDFQAQTKHVNEEVFDVLSRELTHTIRQFSSPNEDGKFWLLRPGRYRAFGLTDSLMGASSELLTPRESST